MGLINLTPLGPNWGWGERVAEIIGQTLSLILIQPIVWIHNGTGWILEQIFGEHDNHRRT